MLYHIYGGPANTHFPKDHGVYNCNDKEHALQLAEEFAYETTEEEIGDELFDAILDFFADKYGEGEDVSWPIEELHDMYANALIDNSYFYVEQEEDEEDTFYEYDV